MGCKGGNMLPNIFFDIFPFASSTPRMSLLQKTLLSMLYAGQFMYTVY